MTTEDWKAFKKEWKDHKNHKAEEMFLKLDKWSKDFEIPVTVLKIQPWHIRVESVLGSEIIDIFPKSNKYHNVRTGQRGRFKDVVKFLEKNIPL